MTTATKARAFHAEDAHGRAQPYAAATTDDPWLAFCSLCDWRVTVNGEREAQARRAIHALTHQGRSR